MAWFTCMAGVGGKGNSVIVTCDADFAGVPITCTNGQKTYTKVCPSFSPYEVTFTGLVAGTWTISATVDGVVYSTTAIVTDITAVLSYGFNWKMWVDSSSSLHSSDYTDLADLLSDEAAIRQLFTEHAPTDYAASTATVTPDLATVLNNDLCAKWINLRDYALDTLYANEIIADYMDEADKYGYGEWVITDNTTTPPTWGAKGNVPVMTANNAPYGVASGDAEYSSTYPAWKAFDDDTSTLWMSTSTNTGSYLQYTFTNPVCVKRTKFISSNGSIAKAELRGSNDNFSTYDVLGTIDNGTGHYGDTTPVYTDYENNSNFYLTYRVVVTERGAIANANGIHTLQFYGRELSVSVPAMTGNTTPYGEASASSNQYDASSFDIYRAFDKVEDATGWYAMATDNSAWIGYKFKSPACIKTLNIISNSYGFGSSTLAFDIEGSNDGITWTKIGDGTLTGLSTTATRIYHEESFDINNNDMYLYYRINFGVKIVYSGTSFVIVTELQFYGLDYSEREFEEGTNKKWLYDHGVELVDIYTAKTGSAVVTKEENAIYIKTANGQMAVCSNNEAIDLTGYNLVRAKNEPMVTTYATPVYAQIFIKPSKATSTSDYSSNYVAVGNFTNEIINTYGLDISAINTAEYIQYGFYGGNSYTENRFKELWLE